ncbi:MAG: plasma-membrane proton-efflux P-type ATPase, partial [Candidatus Eisenbacteria bacterium]|nr:plasma-membrane proton-efflux P-type ATPase [Candidatus Eisenbacteria bacterium]
ATGRETRFARTVELVESAEKVSHFQKAVLRIGYVLIGMTAVLVAVVVLFSIFVAGDTWVQVLLFALGLTLAGIPQALPAVLSVTMSLGAHRLARKKAIVARLPAMEEMAGLEVLCADKTGTLTQNRLEVQDPVLIEAEDEDDLLTAAALTCRRDTDDPIDQAIPSRVGESVSLDEYEVVSFELFDPTRKRADAEVRKKGTTITASKGAPQVILDLVNAGDQLRRRVSSKVDELGEQGYRSLGVARKAGGTYRYLGILPLLDPPREDSAAVIGEAAEHGIDVRMVTGDHAAIGRQVAGQIGLGQHIVEAGVVFPEEGIGKDQEPSEHIEEEVLQADGFAQVTPEHKFNLIRAFQAGDRIVGMTGDGVNDAPALQQANVGIAVAGATDAARSAAHLILTEKGLGVIIHAVEEARRIFERMTSYATFRITETLRVLLFVTTSILVFSFYPVTPIMIVLLAILNDIPIMTIAWDNVREPEHPVRWDMKRVLTIAGILSVAGVISSFLLFWFLDTQLEFDRQTLQTMLFLKLLVAGHMTIFLTRSKGWLWQRPWPHPVLFFALEGTQIAGTLVAVYGFLVHPIGWGKALAVWAYAMVWLFLLDAVKVFVNRRILRTGSDSDGRTGNVPSARET